MQSDTNTILWYDFESFGIDPKYDKAVQFAAIRTDLDLNILEKDMFYCAISSDYLPSPFACLVTKITPQISKEKGLSEYEFCKKIYYLMSQKGTKTSGYNTIRYDDELARYMFFRNYFPPYDREYKNKNSRWDIIDLVRSCYALRPDGINFPKKEDGSVSFKLEDLTKANNITQENAHDALDDVKATIELAKLIKQKQEKLYDYFFHTIGDKPKVKELIDKNLRKNYLVHISNKYLAKNFCLNLIIPIFYHPTNSNAVVCINLLDDISFIDQIKNEDLIDHLYAKKEQQKKRLPIKIVHLNKCPMLVGINILDQKATQKLNIDFKQVEQNLTHLQNNNFYQEKFINLFTNNFNDENQEAPASTKLYQGFIESKDQQRANQMHSDIKNNQLKKDYSFSDLRYQEMFLEFKAKNFQEYLSKDEKIKWHLQLKELLFRKNAPWRTYDKFTKEIIDAKKEAKNNYDLQILTSLIDYAKQLVNH